MSKRVLNRAAIDDKFVADRIADGEPFGLCNRCNGVHNGARCESCGCPEFRLVRYVDELTRAATAGQKGRSNERNDAGSLPWNRGKF